MLKCILVISAAVLCTTTGFAKTANIDDLDKKHKTTVDDAQRHYHSIMVKIIKNSIRQYEYTLRIKTKAGKLDEALALRERIVELNEDIKTHSPEEFLGSSVDKSKLAKAAGKRALEFVTLLIKNKIEPAYSYLNPDVRKHVDKEVLLGHLHVMAGNFKINNLQKLKVGIHSVELNKKQDTAKVTGKYKAANSDWMPSTDSMYLIRSHGQWYMGDDDKLKKLF